MSIKKIGKKIIGKLQRKRAIYDDVIYENDMESFSGSSLSDSNILMVFDEGLCLNKESNVEKIEETEKCNVSLVDSSNISKIFEKQIDIIGGYNHIINGCFIKEMDDVYRIYSLLQNETNYLVSNGCYSTICTVIFANKLNSSEVIAVKGLLESLGEVLPNHNIIGNGIITDDKLSMDEIIPTALFLSSKYGQLLTGHIIEMGVE